MTEATWRKCSVCKRDIGYVSQFYVCSVSTCNSQRTNYAFCSVACFERHLPGARHRDAGAIEKKSPSLTQARAEGASTNVPAAAAASVHVPKRVMATTTASTSSTQASGHIPKEVLVVVSKIKEYIRARAEMNTSDAIMSMLSDRVREICDEAIDSARQEGRKTVLDRDMKKK